VSDRQEVRSPVVVVVVVCLLAGCLQPAGLLGPLEQPGRLPAGRHSEGARVLHSQQCNIR